MVQIQIAVDEGDDLGRKQIHSSADKSRRLTSQACTKANQGFHIVTCDTVAVRYIGSAIVKVRETSYLIANEDSCRLNKAYNSEMRSGRTPAEGAPATQAMDRNRSGDA